MYLGRQTRCRKTQWHTTDKKHFQSGQKGCIFAWNYDYGTLSLNMMAGETCTVGTNGISANTLRAGLRAWYIGTNVLRPEEDQEAG